MGKYDYLLIDYPEYISLDQFHRICHINKQRAVYLLKENIVPYEDTGKRTWKYRIKITDVIYYLEMRDEYGSLIPKGVVSHSPYHKKPSTPFIQVKGNEEELHQYFTFLYVDYPDVLDRQTITDMIGITKRSLLKFLKEEKIQSISKSPKYLVSKAALIEFLCTEEYINFRGGNALYKKILIGFEKWTHSQKKEWRN